MGLTVSSVPELRARPPICSSSSPSGVNFSSMSSDSGPALLPPTQTLPSGSTWMPCSFAGPVVPVGRSAPGADERPVLLERQDGGAAVPWSSPTVRGRCSTQTVSSGPTVTDDVCPSTQSFGMLGHDGSTSNCGTPASCSPVASAAGPYQRPADTPSVTTSATTDNPAMILPRMSSPSAVPPAW